MIRKFQNFDLHFLQPLKNPWTKSTFIQSYEDICNNHETRQDNHDNDCENRQSMVLEGTHVLIYHNKDRLGTGLQLIVAGHDDDEDEVHKRADNDD